MNWSYSLNPLFPRFLSNKRVFRTMDVQIFDALLNFGPENVAYSFIVCYILLVCIDALCPSQ